jgi:hypothetical protein
MTIDVENETSDLSGSDVSGAGSDKLAFSIIPEVGGNLNPSGGKPVGRGPDGLEVCAAACHKAQIGTLNYIQVWKGGTLLKIHRSKENLGENSGGGKREKISDFTWETRMRIIQTMGKLDKYWLPVYWVGTFPDEYYKYRFTGERSVEILKNFRERFRRKYPQRGCIWRREHERRKSGQHIGAFFPHYNFLVWGIGQDEFTVWASRAWYEAAGGLSPDHLKASWRAQTVKNWRQMMYYLSKYVAKKNKDYFADTGWGAWWGIFNRAYLPWVEDVTVNVDGAQVTKLLRYAKRKVHGRRNIDTRIITTENPDFWLERLGDILDVKIDTPE